LPGGREVCVSPARKLADDRWGDGREHPHRAARPPEGGRGQEPEFYPTYDYRPIWEEEQRKRH
jgi:hypothetical protein